MVTSAGAQIVPFYATARALFPILPEIYLILDDGGITPEFQGLTAYGAPQLRVPPNYTLMPHEGYHEAGHAYQKTVERLYPGKDYLALYWIASGRAGTWQQALTESVLLTGNAAFQADPRERWADSFADAVAGSGDGAALRGFFQSLIQPMEVPVVDFKIEWLGPVPATNFDPGRGGQKVELIVDHWMAATFESALAHFMTPGVQVSAHYLISQTGRIVGVVDEKDTAFHAGNYPVNQISIGIEHEASPTQPPSDALYAASAWLHRDIADQYGIALAIGTTVKRHRDIVATQCPGTLDVERIVEMATGGLDMDEATLRRILREEVTQPLSEQQKAGFNTTLVIVARRVIRSLRGSNPPARDPGMAYPDDTTTIT